MTNRRPRFEDGRPLVIAGLRGVFTKTIWQGIPAQWERFVSYLSKSPTAKQSARRGARPALSQLASIPGHIGRSAYGLCFSHPEGLDYLSGTEVASSAQLPDGFSRVTVPAQTYAIFRHRRHVSRLRETIAEIWQNWLPSSGIGLFAQWPAPPTSLSGMGPVLTQV